MTDTPTSAQCLDSQYREYLYRREEGRREEGKREEGRGRRGGEGGEGEGGEGRRWWEEGGIEAHTFIAISLGSNEI